MQGYFITSALEAAPRPPPKRGSLSQWYGFRRLTPIDRQNCTTSCTMNPGLLQPSGVPVRHEPRLFGLFAVGKALLNPLAAMPCRFESCSGHFDGMRLVGAPNTARCPMNAAC